MLDLGTTPLANALLDQESPDAPEAVYPLELVFCPACTLLNAPAATACAACDLPRRR